MSTSSTTWASSSRWKWIAFAAPYSPGIPHLCLSANSPPKVGGRRCGNPGIRPLCRGGSQCSGCLVSHNVLQTFHPHCGEDQRGHQGLYRFLKEPARIAHLELFLFPPTIFFVFLLLLVLLLLLLLLLWQLSFLEQRKDPRHCYRKAIKVLSTGRAVTKCLL